MFFFIRKFIICLLIYPFWLLATPEIESLPPFFIGIDKYYDKINEEEFLENFITIIFENASCDCGPNDGCSRGCRPEDQLNGEQYSGIRSCTRKKSLHYSSDNCAQHITGAIMTIIHDSLASNYCKNISYLNFDHQQCLDNFIEDTSPDINENINICRHGFKFEAALCMLNLDGQDPDIYREIRYKSVRAKCKNWDSYNQRLLAIYESISDEEILRIPLFKRIDPDKYTTFKKAPDSIPTGAIIIAKSTNKNGHVEVKTDREECGDNKNQTCFCSDYCRERTKYTQPVLAVFEWNPEFIRYINDY